MFRKKNWKWLLIVAVVASVLTVGASVVMAQTGDDTRAPRAGTHFASMPRGEGWGENDTYLADSLGITAEELASAQQAAEEARVAQAVADGKITQEQADSFLPGEASGFFSPEGFGGRGGFHGRGPGHFDGFQGQRPSQTPEADSDNL